MNEDIDTNFGDLNVPADVLNDHNNDTNAITYHKKLEAKQAEIIYFNRNIAQKVQNTFPKNKK